jgi:starch phosphorylase
MFPGYPIGSITNGVHSVTWTAPPFRALYDRRIPEWRRDGFALRYALEIPLPEIHEAHEEAKRQLLRVVNTRANAGFDQHALTLGFARRATAYKRPTLLLRDPDRLRKLARVGEGIQVVFAGKAHPRDEDGKRLIREIVAAAKALEPEIKIAYLANHDLELGLLVTAGVDVWLNTPRAPYEASGTSGMKAAHNGVPSLSARDGWWLEGHIEGVTGWAIGAREPLPSSATSDEQDAADLYERLERDVARLYYGDRARWAELMRSTIAVNASYFNTQRMLHQYATYAYREVPEA